MISLIGDLSTFLREKSINSVKKEIQSNPYLVDAACIFCDGGAYNFKRLTNFSPPWWMSNEELERILKEIKDERDDCVKNQKERKKKK